MKLKPNGYAADAAESDAHECRHALPPGRPDVSPAVPGALDLIFASRNTDFGDSGEAGATPKWQTFGYDLDDTCTGEGQGDSCAEPTWAMIDHPDGIDGRDNAITLASTRIL